MTQRVRQSGFAGNGTGRHPRFPYALAGVAILASLCATTGLPLQAATVVRGVIEKDQVWRGRVKISSDVTIKGADVRVEPGTVIQFDKPGSLQSGPVILLNSPAQVGGRPGEPARLILAGSPAAPIVIESQPRQPRGSILSAAASAATLFARHVVFRRMGVPVSPQVTESAVHIRLGRPGDDAWVSHCRFEDCGPLRLEAEAMQCTVSVEENAFIDSSGELTLEVAGPGRGVKVVRGNRGAGEFRLSASQVLLRDNILIGPTARISIPGGAGAGLRIVSNYVHCTAQRGWGQCALRCDATQAVLIDNVLMGGTYVVAAGPDEIRGNVLVGQVEAKATSASAPHKRVWADSRRTLTHNLLTDHAPGARIQGNLFIGPSRTALAVSRDAQGVRIVGNIFDGWGRADEAIRFHVLSQAPAKAHLLNNVFLGYRGPPVRNGAFGAADLAEAGGNLFLAPSGAAYQGFGHSEGLPGGDIAFGGQDVWCDAKRIDVAEIRSMEQKLTDGRSTVKEVRRQWFIDYRIDPERLPAGHPWVHLPGPSAETSGFPLDCPRRER